MPCDRVYTTSVNLEVADRDLLVKALEALGYHVYRQVAGQLYVVAHGEGFYIESDGRMRLPNTLVAIVPQIKQSYAAQCVQASAQKFGWRVTQKSPQQLMLTRRR